MRKLLLALLFTCSGAAYAQEASAGASGGMDVSLMQKQDSMRREAEVKIKKEILDPIFGADRAFVFADVEMEVVSKKAEQTKEGVGIIQKYKEKGSSAGENADADFLLPGIPKPRSVLGKDNKRPEASQGQQAQQGKGVQEVRYGVGTEITRFQLTVIHDDTLAKDTLKLARERIDDYLLPYKIRGIGAPTVVFKPTKFKAMNVTEDLKRPNVYLPLLYAALALLFLMFLFGPLWGFFRKYVKAMMAKPGAEVNIEQKTEEGGGGGAGDGDQKQEGHQSIDMNFLQKSEEETEDEDELMKKFEPFTYITDENLRKLIYYFLLKKEDPWVIALVLSYMKVELSRQALSMLPMELQSRVALESLTVRQATREQIEAIDKEVRENVDFVMGGVESLAKMLEESDPPTRKNIIEYLKTQKPDIYEKIKKIILTFETLTGFSDKDLQTLIRSISNEDIARAISGADPQLVNKLFANMSQGAVSAIKEIMEYSGDISTGQIDEARTKILDAVKALEAEGKINFRQQDSQEVYIIDGGELSSGDQRRKKFESMGAARPAAQEAAPAPAADPAKADEAAQYLAAGANLYNQGRVEESLQYLEYASSANPAEPAVWQYLGGAYYGLGRVDEAVAAYERYAAISGDPAVREWVNGFRQQVGK